MDCILISWLLIEEQQIINVPEPNKSVFLATLLGSMGEWQSDLRTRLGSPFAISMLSVLIPSQGLH